MGDQPKLSREAPPTYITMSETMDIVERLRRQIACTHPTHLLCYEAADEIERLRDALRRIGKLVDVDSDEGPHMARRALEEN